MVLLWVGIKQKTVIIQVLPMIVFDYWHAIHLEFYDL